MKFLNRNRAGDESNASTAVPSPNHSLHDDHVHDGNSQTGGRGGNKVKLAKIPNITMRTFVMTILVAMGGFIFGYDTGQISGFLEMQVFLEMFGIPTEVSEKHKFGYYFTNVRSGLIVALVSNNPANVGEPT